MRVLSLLQSITGHPLNRRNKPAAILRFVNWQLRVRMNSSPKVHQFTQKSRLLVTRGMTGATGNIYNGLHEFHDMGFLLHFLRPEDFFIDAGANVGTYTVLASGHVAAKTFSFEPAPATFRHLSNNINLNELGDKVTAFNTALGSATGSISFTSTLDTMNHVAKADDPGTIAVPVRTLDEVIADRVAPALIKIDVEGFETEVLKGASETLADKNLKAIIIELNGSGARYGYDEAALHNGLHDHGFRRYCYNPFDRALTAAPDQGTHNTIYARDPDFVKDRVSTAEKVRILGQEV